MGCGRQPASAPQKPAPPARVSNPAQEAHLATVTLSPQAEARLAIRTAGVEYKPVVRVRTFAGEVLIPPGRSIAVSAPVAGRLAAPAGGGVPAAGMTLQKGQPVFRLQPLIPPERDLRVEVEREVASQQARWEAAAARVHRAEQVLRDQAGSARALEEARTELALAEAALKAAKARQQRLTAAPLLAEDELVMESPQTALLRQIYAAPGQTVAAGGALFEVASLSPVWIRVPVYVGDLNSVEPEEAARVHGLNQQPGPSARAARPVTAPPSADPDAATADLFYELSNEDRALRPGQKVGVTLTLRGRAQSLVVPWSAVLYDVQGGTWVYENSAPQEFIRRRVEVRHVAGGLAHLARGPVPGAKIVTTGAAELFSTEFGIGK